MSTAWEELRAAGVPVGAVCAIPTEPVDAGRWRAALGTLCAENFEGLEEVDRECLFAWLRAFQHHWPERFEAVFPQIGTRALTELSDPGRDDNRYLKLRRIAVENLSRTL
ncbi:MAG TPA: hypothetical protein VGP07_21210 [Polyangia bacterium]|jgi:hypothetical protein